MKSLSFRLTLWYALVVTSTVGCVLFVGRFYLEDYLIAGIDLLNEVEFEEIRARLDDSDAAGPELVDAIKEHAELDAALYFFQIGGEGGEPLWKSSNLGPEVLPQAVHGHAHVTVFDDELGLIRSSEFSYAGLDIHIVSSLSNAEVLFHGYQTASVSVAVAVFLLSLGFGYFLSRLAMRPIAGIQMTARQITASNFDARIPVPNTNDEVSEMAVFLNEMLDRLETSYQQVKRFTAEASHEFRTPLSIIRLQAERLMDCPDLSETDRESALAEQMEGIGRLNKVMDDLLLLAKSDAGVMPLDLHSVDLKDYLEDFRCDCELLAEDQGVEFELDLRHSGEWVFDPVWMRNVLLNLFTNALNVSRTGQCVRLEIEVRDGCLHLRMEDEGPGLPEQQLELMFNRFERLDQSNGHTHGNGLGLAICRSIVQRHGGRIFASNRTDQCGLCVEIVLNALTLSSRS